MSDSERMPRPDAVAGGGSPEPEAAAAAPQPPVPPRPVPPVVEAPTPDVALADDASPLPGTHRGGFQRLPTAPVDVTVQTAPTEPGTEDAPESWSGDQPITLQRGLAGWALGFAAVGLLVSLFVGWGIPIGTVAIVSGILALRRPFESRALAVWGIALGVLSLLYSAGWLLYASALANLVG